MEIKMDYKHSPVLFRDEYGKGLHLVIKSVSQKNELIRMVKFGGGLLFNKATECSVTFASPDREPKDDDEELYSHTYINDCCLQNKLLNLKPYRLNKESKYPDDFNPNDVFLKYTTWTDALQGKPVEKSQLSFRPDESSTEYSGSSDSTAFPGTEKHVDSAQPVPSSSQQDLSEASASQNYYDTCCRTEKHVDSAQPVPSSPQQNLSDTSASHKRGEEHVDSSQPVPSSQKQVPSDTSASPKRNRRMNRLIKTLVMETSDSEFDCDEVSDRDEEKLFSENRENDQPHTRQKVSELFAKEALKRKATKGSSSSESDFDFMISPVNSLEKRKRNQKVMRREYTEAERRKIIDYIIEKKAYNSVRGREFWQKMEADKICPERTWQSLKEHFVKKIFPRIDRFNLSEEEVRKFKGIESSSDSSDSDSSGPSSAESKRREYSKFEKLKIIHYIIDHKAYDFVKGREFWQKMEANEICPGRTWQSMKEHYMKQILPRLRQFDIPMDERQKLKQAFIS